MDNISIDDGNHMTFRKKNKLIKKQQLYIGPLKTFKGVKVFLVAH